MYLTAEVCKTCEMLFDVVFPSRWATSLKRVILWAPLSAVAMNVYRKASVVLFRRTRTEYGGQVKDSCGGIG
jgi:hypothetical protein